jgi:TonB family protein
MMKRVWAWAAIALLMSVGAAAAQEGVGPPAWRLRTDEIQAAYPPAAKAKGLGGSATIGCDTWRDQIWNCAVTAETPAGEGFGEAALGVVRRYQSARPSQEDRRRAVPYRIDIAFVPPEARTVRAGGHDYRLPVLTEAPSLDAVYAAWPRAERFSGVQAAVDLSCVVTPQGRLDACKVTQVSRFGGPAFVKAAMEMIPLFAYQPGLKDGAPAAMTMLVRVPFTCDSRCRPFEGVTDGRGTPWTVAPTPAQVEAVYPAGAKARGVEGQARLACGVADDRLDACRVVAESVKGEGFGEAALRLVPIFRLTPGRTEVSLSVDFGTQPGKPQWLHWRPYMPNDPRTAVKGQARVTCRIVVGGALEDCRASSVEPDDPAVAAEAAKAAMGVIPQIWTEEGRSTLGESLELDVPVGRLAPPSLALAAPVEPTPTPGVIDYRPMSRSAKGIDISRFYPDRAQRMSVSGRVQLSCQRIRAEKLEDCVVLSESPADYGFGAAALKMSAVMAYRAETVDGAPTEGPVVIPLEFQAAF